jgi:lipopolysaccharide export system protein LptA
MSQTHTHLREAHILRKACSVAALMVALVFCGPEATAQKPQPQGPQNALQGFSQNRDQPVKIQAASLEVRDKEKIATFSGDVHVTNGDTELRSKVLVVFYDEDPKAQNQNMKAADPGPGGEKSIKRIEAKGGVVVVQKDQVANGDSAVFNMRENIVTLVGNVVITKGENVLRGPRLVVDLTNGVSKMDGGPISAVFDTRKPPDPKGGEKK